jgi:molybdopterin/thiamine biosynthesis adenylyltransferase
MASKQNIPRPTVNSIGIAGAGGIGGFVAANLFNYGANRNQFEYSSTKIDIYDDDIVDASNLLHQNYTDEDIGKYKATLCAERFFMNPELRFMEAKDFPNYDVIFSCVDSMTFRKELYEWGWANPGKLFWIDGRCQSRQVGLYHSKLSRAKIEKDLTDSKERAGCLLAFDKKNKTSHATPQVIASMMVQTFLNYIRGEIDTQSDKIVMMI